MSGQGPYKPSAISSKYPNYLDDLDKCHTFLREAQDSEGNLIYPTQLQLIADRKQQTIDVQLDQVAETLNDQRFVQAITTNAVRYHSLFSRAIDSMMPPPSADMDTTSMTPHEIYQYHREMRFTATLDQLRAVNPDAATAATVQSPFPVELSRRFELRLLPSASKPSHMRHIQAKDVGHLVCVNGIVTRVSDVQPLIQVVTYICQVCGYESYQSVNDKEFLPLTACPSPACRQNESVGKLQQQTRGSKFIRYQVVKLQELPHEVPVGHVPRSLTLRLEASLTRTCKPGDYITVGGIYLPAPYTGFRAIRAGLTTDTYIHTTSIQSKKQSYKDTVIDADMDDQITDLSQRDSAFDELAQSIAPEIYGHNDIKKALILMLAGGVTRHLADGLKIRGDINVLLCGDPGVAKSQLLKHLGQVAPRCVYTTGKGSSGVGLTAAVLRDPVTGDMTLEGGALVLADMGICCIDEFDKMEESDRTAIHEVMEQQTVSIAKAGITTTLNARTSIVAAANPVWGRWKPRASIEENIGLPTALLSRFDLTFIILDTPDSNNDEELAKHVTYVHQNSKPPQLTFTPFSPAFLRAYVSKAKSYNPIVPKSITDFIVGSYVSLRKETNENDVGGGNNFSTRNTRTQFCTARMLLSILRLSQALARIHFRDAVSREDVDEAIRLLTVSKAMADGENPNNRPNKVDFLSDIFDIVRRHAQDHQQNIISRADIRNKVVTRNYTDEQLQQTLDEYEELGIWQCTHSHIRMLNSIEA